MPELSCAVDTQGTKVTVTCRGLQAGVGYRAKATCLMGNNTGMFIRYGDWQGTGAPNTSTADCGAEILAAEFEVPS
ncbi:hypothetical protein [Streptomyces sp. N35]|uniref:hypothetical protein n=1 Tax=Streptomyces sp. N35 TaxID=2795730 RepID=UPI0018F7424F|nr:hypothetical protein [Streptomyces sp. N35]